MNQGSDAPDFQGFWQWFADHNHELLEIMGGRRAGKVTDVMDQAMSQHHLTFVYEVTEGPFGGELTFTPEGDPALARLIDRFVAQAPSFDTWVVHSRRHRKSFKAALAFVNALHGIDLTGLHFKVRKLSGQFHLLFIHAGLSALEENHRFAVAATFLDHAVGEAVAMSFVGSIDFRDSGEGLDAPLVVNQIIREAESEAAAAMAAGA